MFVEGIQEGSDHTRQTSMAQLQQHIHRTVLPELGLRCVVCFVATRLAI